MFFEKYVKDIQKLCRRKKVMNRALQLSFVFFISGALFFLFSVLIGEIEIGDVLFFPFYVGSGIYTYLDFISIFIANILSLFKF